MLDYIPVCDVLVWSNNNLMYVWGSDYRKVLGGYLGGYKHSHSALQEYPHTCYEVRKSFPGLKVTENTVVPPPQYCLQYHPSVDRHPPNTAADFQVPNMFFLVKYDSLYHRCSNTTVFSPVPRAAVLGGGVDCIAISGVGISVYNVV